MSNLDPQSHSSIYEEINFHDEVDDDFCRAITEAYRDSNLRVVLQADHFFRQLPGTIHGRYPSPKSYERVLMAPPETEGLLIDGRISGARMVPTKEYVGLDESGEFVDDVGGYRFKYLPYAVLSDVVTVPLPEEESLVISDEYEEIWVPIEIESMTLYQPAT